VLALACVTIGSVQVWKSVKDERCIRSVMESEYACYFLNRDGSYCLAVHCYRSRLDAAIEIALERLASVPEFLDLICYRMEKSDIAFSRGPYRT